MHISMTLHGGMEPLVSQGKISLSIIPTLLMPCTLELHDARLATCVAYSCVASSVTTATPSSAASSASASASVSTCTQPPPLFYLN